MSTAVTDLACLVHDLSEPDYHSHASLSQSGAKVILESPARFHWERAHPRPATKAMEHGSIAHALVLGTGPEIVPIAADDWRTKAAREDADEVRERGALPVLLADHARIGAMADKLREHKLAMRLLDGATDREVSVFVTCPTTGIPMRGRVDALDGRLVIDYKTTAKADARGFGRAALDYGYHIQAAWYLDLMEFLGQPREGFAFIVQSKVPPFEVAVVELAPRAVDHGRRLGLEARERFRDCTDAGVWPGVVDPRSVLIVDLPPWGYSDGNYSEEVSIT